MPTAKHFSRSPSRAWAVTAMIGILTVKYDAAGTFGWDRRYTGFEGDAWGRSIAVDAAENVYVAGYASVGGDVSTSSSVLAIEVTN